jgi:hypothetical protein
MRMATIASASSNPAGRLIHLAESTSTVVTLVNDTFTSDALAALTRESLLTSDRTKGSVIFPEHEISSSEASGTPSKKGYVPVFQASWRRSGTSAQGRLQRLGVLGVL